MVYRRLSLSCPLPSYASCLLQHFYPETEDTQPFTFPRQQKIASKCSKRLITDGWSRQRSKARSYCSSTRTYFLVCRTHNVLCTHQVHTHTYETLFCSKLLSRARKRRQQLTMPMPMQLAAAAAAAAAMYSQARGSGGRGGTRGAQFVYTTLSQSISTFCVLLFNENAPYIETNW